MDILVLWCVTEILYGMILIIRKLYIVFEMVLLTVVCGAVVVGFGFVTGMLYRFGWDIEGYWMIYEFYMMLQL